jgi:carboxylesterase
VTERAPAADASPRRWWPRRHPVATTAIGLASALVLGVTIVVVTPLLDSDLRSDAAPATSFTDAMVLADELLAADGADVNPLCRSEVRDQGERTDVAVVLLHGYTNCPQQWAAVAQAYAAEGHSVVVPRLPGHGLTDRLTSSLSRVTADDLTTTADLAVDIAAGLGDEVWVVGLSGGGTLAGWLAAERDEVTEATLIAPLVVPKVLPEAFVGPLVRAFRFAPDVSLWWDGTLKEALASPPYAYPRYTLRSLAAFLAVGRSTQTVEPGRTTDLARLVLVTNENDAAISNSGAEALAQALEPVLADDADRQAYVFDAELGYRHDVVDPQGENAEQLDAIYPVLGPLMGLPELRAP